MRLVIQRIATLSEIQNGWTFLDILLANDALDAVERIKGKSMAGIFERLFG